MSPLGRRPRRRALRALGSCAFLLLGVSPVCAAPLNERIAVSSTAAPDYKREIPGKPGVRPETYLFMQGQFFQSGTRDRGLESMTFEKLTQTLAKDLVKQEYYPTKDVNNADLIIMIYWGASLIYEDPQKDNMIDSLNTAVTQVRAQVADGGIGDTGALNNVSESMASSQDTSERALQRNAALMGFTRTLAKTSRSAFMTEEEKSLRTELSEERYFVVLMAYDFQTLKKQKIRHLRWVTRLSVRSPGNNFADAMPVLSQAGSHVFGHDLKGGLVHIKANLREARISLGDLKVVETVEPTPAPPAHP
ncbi:MAG: hypothetical protein ABIS43_17360 [Opitutus sp.]